MPSQNIPLPTQHADGAKADPSLKTILVVDDEQPILDLLCDTLEDVGYTILTAPNGNAALGIVEHTIPDLVLTDLMMPVMDGQTLCTRLRSDTRTARIPILLMTAARQPQLEAPFTDVIPKPFSLDTVLEQIERHLR